MFFRDGLLALISNFRKWFKFIFFLYREIILPRTTREKVNFLILPQINFQQIKFSFWLKVYPFFHFFSKAFPWSASSIRLARNIFSSLYKYIECTNAYYNVSRQYLLIILILMHVWQYSILGSAHIQFLNFMFEKKLVYWCFIETIMLRGPLDNVVHNRVKTWFL